MFCRHSSGLEQVLHKILRKSLEELPLHCVLVRGLYHVACMALEFIIEHQSSLTTRKLSLSITICRVLRSNFMYKSFIHATDEVFKVPFTLMESLWSPVTLYTRNQRSNLFNQVSNTSMSSSPEYFSGADTLIFLNWVELYIHDLLGHE